MIKHAKNSSNIYDGTFYENNLLLLAVDYFRKKPPS